MTNDPTSSAAHAAPETGARYTFEQRPDQVIVRLEIRSER